MAKSLYWFYLSDILLSTWGSVKISDAISFNGIPLWAASFTNEPVVLQSWDENIYEIAIASASGWVLTFSKRGLDQSDVQNEVTANKLEWRPGTYCYLTQLAFNTVDKSNPNTFAEIQTFNKAPYFLLWYRGPIFADTIARDAAITSPVIGMQGIFVTSLWVYQDYYPGGWQSQGTTTTPNATTTVAGKWVVATPTQIVNWTNTDAFGQPVFVQPSDMKVANDNIDYEWQKIKTRLNVRAASNTNINIASPWSSIWWVTPSWSTERYLLFSQSTPSQNGIYIWNGAAVPMTRATDFDAVSVKEVTLWAEVRVNEWTFAWFRYTLTTTWTITLWSTNLTFAQSFPPLTADISAKATQAAGTSISFNSWGVVNFDSEAFDTSTIHDNVTNNSRLTVPTAQNWKYTIKAQVQLPSSNCTGIRIRKNGSTVIAQQSIWDTTSITWTNSVSTWNISVDDVAVAADYYEVLCYNKAGTSQTTVIADTWFSIKKFA